MSQAHLPVPFIGRPSGRFILVAIMAVVLAAVAASGGFAPRPASAQAPPLPCTDGPITRWDAGNGHLYQMICAPPAPEGDHGGIDWGIADSQAQAMGGYLGTVTSAAENAFVFSLTNFAMYWRLDAATGPHHGPWLGGFQDPMPCTDPPGEPTGCWTWVTGEPFIFDNWAPGEPNDFRGLEHWLNYGNNQENVRTADWNDSDDSGDVSGEQPVAFVVEWSWVLSVEKAFDGDPAVSFEFLFETDNPAGCLISVAGGDPEPILDGDTFELLGGETADIFCGEGTASVTEIADDPSWAFTSLDCSAGTVDGMSVEVVVSPDEVAECLFTNRDLPGLTIRKVCPNGDGDGDADFNILVTQLETVVAADALDCGELIFLPNLEAGLYTIQELIIGPDANNFVTGILCTVDGGTAVTPGTLASVELEAGGNIDCNVINVFDPAEDEDAGDDPAPPAPPPVIIVPIDLDNTNTNALNNVNDNDNNNENTNTQEQSNQQEQTNDNNQTTTVNSSPSVVIDFD